MLDSEKEFLPQRRKGAKQDPPRSRRSSFAPLRLCVRIFLKLATTLIIASFCVVLAQEQAPQLKPSVSPKTTEPPTKLLLEITYNRSMPPAYSDVNGPGETAKWLWVSRFTRIPGRQAPTDKLPIGAVRFEPVFNGETADVKVTVLRGKRGFTQEDLVGVYKLGIGEQLKINDLDKFDIEPFDITLLNTVPPLPPAPDFENLTKSIQIANVQMENIPKPAYRITLRNSSDKNVIAIRTQLMTDGRLGETTLFLGEDGRPLLAPGSVAEKYIPVIRGVPTATGYAPGAPTVTMIGIRTVVFDDLSFEGEETSACMVESMVMGQRLWLKQIVTLLDQELSKPVSDHIEAAKQFKEKFAAMRLEFDLAERDKRSSVAATCLPPAGSARNSAQSAKLGVLRELEDIIRTRPAPPVNFKSWMEAKQTRYKAWLARL